MFNKCGRETACTQSFKIMFEKQAKYIPTQIVVTPTEKGETIEEMLRRLTANKEPIPQNVPPIYTPKADGVIPDYDIRADRFDVAMMARDKYAASKIAESAAKGDGGQGEQNNGGSGENADNV